MRPQPIRIGDSRKRVLASATAQQASSINVLGPILSGQHILLQDKNIQISIGDGRLVSSMSVDPDKLLFSPSQENDSSGYDSFGNNRGSPARIRNHGSDSRGIVTAAGNSGGTNASNTREAGGSGSVESSSSNLSAGGTSSSSGSSRVPASSRDIPSHSVASAALNRVNNSAESANPFEDFGVLDEHSNRFSPRKKDNPTESEKEEEDEFNIYSDIEGSSKAIRSVLASFVGDN